MQTSCREVGMIIIQAWIAMIAWGVFSFVFELNKTISYLEALILVGLLRLLHYLIFEVKFAKTF